MANKLFLIGTLLIAAIVILGCSAKQETAAQTTPAVQNEPAITVNAAPEIPVYEAPLDVSKMFYTCQTSNDCVLMKIHSFSGLSEKCISSTSGYTGESSSKCECKFISTSEQSYLNGTVIKQDNYECRHI